MPTIKHASSTGFLNIVTVLFVKKFSLITPNTKNYPTIRLTNKLYSIILSVIHIRMISKIHGSWILMQAVWAVSRHKTILHLIPITYPTLK